MFRSRKALQVADVSREISVAPSTAHRLLQTLRFRGFVVQDSASKLYVAGPALLDVGLSAVRDHDVGAAARPFVAAVAEKLGETTHLAVLRGASVVFLDSVETIRPLRVGSRTATSIPAHATSAGKVLLAELSTASLRSLLPNRVLTKVTERTITDRTTLESELTVIREQGYALNVEESESDVSAVAVAIPAPPHVEPASISVSIPTSRFESTNLGEVVSALSKAARSVGERLGA